MIYPDEVTYSDVEYRNLQKYLCQLNRVIPFEIWPPPDIDAHWDTVPNGPYYQQILQALQEYKADIPDPSEWSQEYPMHCSQVEMERIRLLNSTLQDDKDDKDDSCGGIDPDYDSEWSIDSAQLSHSNANS
ncbi:hypothetical protein J1N35_045335 [Gossypium stocksii]|uniref:Uncharacterized protein n=1 Tax=Gossypium stocksii TaxID=47602 RepID=A0A9D3UAT3_9ROSI|nr:hypothetical protein J1N35_045335 [Gossypium stocksii]